MQLIFVANKELPSKTHQMAYQRALENGVEKFNYWDNYIVKRSGEYSFTSNGFNEAKKMFSNLISKYTPILKDGCNFELTGTIIRDKVLIKVHRARTSIYINNISVSPASEVCKKFGITPTKGIETAQIYDFAIDNNFEMKWLGKLFH